MANVAVVPPNPSAVVVAGPSPSVANPIFPSRPVMNVSEVTSGGGTVGYPILS
jgi:hypothetical protein